MPSSIVRSNIHGTVCGSNTTRLKFYTCSGPAVPAERDVGGHLVDLALVREAIIAGEEQKLLPVGVGVHGPREARSASLQADKRLPNISHIRPIMVYTSSAGRVKL